MLTLCFAPLPFQGWGVRPLPTWTALPPHLARSYWEKMDFEAKLMSAFQKLPLQMEFIHPFFPSCHQCSWASILTDARPTGPDRNEGAWFLLSGENDIPWVVPDRSGPLAYLRTMVLGVWALLGGGSIVWEP